MGRADIHASRHSDRRPRAGLLLIVIAAGFLTLAAGCGREQDSAAGIVAGEPDHLSLSYNKQIQPILSEHCYQCHGPDPGSREGELRLDLAESALGEREEGGPAILPGDPDRSPLVQRIESSNANERMPPPEAHKTLDQDQIALLRRWVAEGARFEPHWAFVAPERQPVPELGDDEAIRNPIDRFILARLKTERLAFSPEADRHELLRRASLDLTGLPPTIEEQEAFMADRKRGAYERAVDRLLARPQFGEHRARHWLDYARYSDTHGHHHDGQRALWPYRDYVIRAFAENKPYDRFVREQLAGDLLPDRSVEALIATGFVRANLSTNEGGTVTEEVQVALVRDRVEAFGATFLGLTTGCAACHDHKFDPLTQRDFYGLAAFLGNTREKPWDGNLAEYLPVARIPAEANRETHDAVLARRSALQKRLDVVRGEGRERVAAWIASGNRPRRVSADGLELRLKFDEGEGDVVRNSAPAADPATFTATTNPLVWGERSWFWPTMRMDVNTRFPLGNVGDVEADETFSAGGWLMLRGKPGMSGRGTGSGSLFSRMGGPERLAGRGWEIYQEGERFRVRLVHEEDEARISVVTDDTFARDEWWHVFFTYDGSHDAKGVRLYVNGSRVEVDIEKNNLEPGQSIRTDATTHLGRRDDSDPLRETRFTDIRFYRRELAPDEVAQLPYEDIATEIVERQPDPSKWTTDEAFVAVDRFFLGQIDSESVELLPALAAHDAALEALSAGGPASLIALERDMPAYSDVLHRGDYFSRGERVEPATPEFLPPLPQGSPRTRLGLADWLLAPDHPLFARVAVNRMWQEVFGRGLVETAGDFGVMGARATHPELLDWLAIEFRECGWDTKAMYRLLVTSATYRQSARVSPELLEKDPDNLLLARGPRFRMDAEMLRDSALAASGLLVGEIGGPSVKPYQPPGVWEAVAMPESNTSVYERDNDDALYRRSLYTFWKRSAPPASMETFDAPSREVVCAGRARTNTPLQAFVTMNDPQWVEAARLLASRALRAEDDTAGRLQFMARLTVSRLLQPDERRVLGDSLDRFMRHFASDAALASGLVSVGEMPVDADLDPAELASWTLVASQFFNLDEFLTK